ncbi:hypothetical protein [Bacillus sp. NTK034]|uniref:hypothetical protein n=1 Tax=Bacillus sp. NTK034 TaxID=2802176 RepID=UPI001A906D97|nr:hypothetical protein [Bacillus sp. NTK034]MBN8201141.1 hypothetical protein [Bacillus sp. NTK034]
MNIFEKRLAELANLPSVIPGDQINVTPDCLFVSGQNSLNVIKAFTRLGCKNAKNPARILFSPRDAEVEDILRFCTGKGIRVIDCDLSQYFRTENIPMNGMVIAGIDEGIKCLGGRGAIPIVISPDSMAACLATGSFSMFIPETAYIEVNGALSGNVNGKMLCSHLLDIFDDSLIGNAVILGGTVFDELNDEDLKDLSRFFQLSGTAAGICSPGGPFGQVESVIKIKSETILI